MVSTVAEVIQQHSIEEWILATVQERGPQTLDQLRAFLPQASWSQLVLAVDRLSRHGDISMRMQSRGDYLIAVS
jgi:hypothetical protein